MTGVRWRDWNRRETGRQEKRQEEVPRPPPALHGLWVDFRARHRCGTRVWTGLPTPLHKGVITTSYSPSRIILTSSLSSKWPPSFVKYPEDRVRLRLPPNTCGNALSHITGLPSRMSSQKSISWWHLSPEQAPRPSAPPPPSQDILHPC